MAQQQYLPASYGNLPRYASTTLGVPYVSAYDPSVSDRYGQMMQQEYMKGTAANQGLAQREAEIGDIYSEDLEGKEEVLGKYKGKIDKIREAYGHDLALAAPELARAVAQERSNPWYAKNVKYTQESQRRQKLLDQYGPNVLFMPGKDLPQGNLNQIDMEDIGFDYVNRLHLQDNFQTTYGDYAKKTTDLGLEIDPEFPAFAKQRTRKGITDTELNDLAEGEGRDYITNLLEGMNLEPTPENIEMLTGEFKSWGKGLIGGEDVRVMQNYGFDADGGGGVSGQPLAPPNRLIYTGQVQDEILSDKEREKEGETLYQSYKKGDATPEQENFFNENQDLLKKFEYTEQAKKFKFGWSIPKSTEKVRVSVPGGLPLTVKLPYKVTAEDMNEIESSLQQGIVDNLSFSEALQTSKVIDLVTPPEAYQGDGTGMSMPSYYAINNEKIRKRDLADLREQYNKATQQKKKDIDQYERELSERMFPNTGRAGYVISATEGTIDKVNEYLAGTMIGTETDYDSLSKRTGITVYKDSGNNKSDRATGNALQAIGNFDFDASKQMGAIKYIGPGSRGTAPSLTIKTSEGRVEVPLGGFTGSQHGMQLSLLVNNPTIINDVFNYNYDSILDKTGGSVEISNVLGLDQSILEEAGLSNIARIKANTQVADALGVGEGSKIYAANVEGKGTIIAETPNELIFQIATHLGSTGLLRATDPIYEYLNLQNNELASPKNVIDSNFNRMQ